MEKVPGIVTFGAMVLFLSLLVRLGAIASGINIIDLASGTKKVALSFFFRWTLAAGSSFFGFIEMLLVFVGTRLPLLSKINSKYYNYRKNNKMQI